VLPGQVEADALQMLLRFDPLAGSRLLEELLAVDGFFWRKRALRALEDAKVLGRDELWSTGSPPRFLGTGIHRTLAKYAADADVGIKALELLIELGGRRADVPELAPALGAALRSQDAALRESGKRLVRQKHMPDCLQPLFQSLLREEDADLRLHAAQVLVQRYQDPRVLELAGDPEPAVRTLVARFLSSLTAWGEGERAIIQTLLADGDPEVLNEALKLVSALRTEERRVTVPPEDLYDPRYVPQRARAVHAEPLPPECYRALLSSRNHEVRAWLASMVQRLPAPLAFELLRALAGDQEKPVLAPIPRTLYALWWEDPAATLEIAGLLLASPALERASTLNELRNLFGLYREQKSTTMVLVGWALIQADDVFLASDLKERELQALTPELLRAYSVRMFPLDFERTRTLLVGRHADAARGRAFAQLAADGVQHPVLRLLAARASLAAGPPDEGWIANARALLAEPFWRTLDLGAWGWVPRELYRLVDDCGATRNALILQLVSDRSLAPGLFEMAALRYDPASPGGQEIARAILARWFDDPEPAGRRLVSRVLEDMGTPGALVVPELLVRASGIPEYARSALQAMGDLRDQRYLPVLEQLIRDPPSPYHLSWAAQALFKDLSEESAELLLLAAARTQDADLRDQCLAHLEKIREYQDARARWATRKVQARTREQVLAELLTLVDGPGKEQRLAAIQGLATWEAVEAMPRLIELLADADPDIAAAARAALARLNAPSQPDREE
jgi:HEAT repeat protein